VNSRDHDRSHRTPTTVNPDQGQPER